MLNAFRRTVPGVAAVALFAVCAHSQTPAQTQEQVLTAMSASGQVKGVLAVVPAFQVGPLQTAVLSLRAVQGDSALSDAEIAVDGGMPEHGHGLPTRPRVTENLGDGRYRISGLRFTMSGNWVLVLPVRTAAVSDTLTF